MSATVTGIMFAVRRRDLARTVEQCPQDTRFSGERRETEHIRHALARTRLVVHRIPTGGVHPDQHLGGQRRGARQVDRTQHLRSAEGVLADPARAEE
jgi:hypothetical protein